MVTLEDVWNYNIPYLDISVGALIIAVIVAIVAYLALIRIVLPSIRRGMTRANAPPLVVDLFARVLRMLFMIIVLLIFLSLIGFDVSSIVLAMSAIIGLVLAFGMSDSMNNFFAGVWIAMLRPFNKGDVVDVAGKVGKVHSVGIMATELRSPDNKTIIIPNRTVWGEAVVNYTRQPIRRVDVDVGIAYGASVSAALETAMKVMKKHPQVIDDPEPSVFMTELADSSVNLQLRPWSRTDDYWAVAHDIRRGILEALPDAGVEIPFPQLDLHIQDMPEAMGRP